MPCSPIVIFARPCSKAAAIPCCPPRTTSPRWSETSRPLSRRPRGFPPRQQALLAADCQQASDTTKGHGRLEKRTLQTTTVLNDCLDWPKVGQVFWLVRERTEHGQTSVEEVYGITSLTRQEANATHLLDVLRGHWGIENRLHYVRDVTMGEDSSRV